MIKGKTESGFEFELDDDVLDDYEILDALVKIDRGETLLIVDIVDKILGVEQKEKLKKHIRAKSGRVSIKKMVSETMQIFDACNKLKNC